MEQNNDLPSSSAPTKENNFTRKLVCINYPGIVENVDKMLDTLGGLTEIENVVGERNRYLELRFRPEDKFCKPALSETDKKPGILVKVTKKEINGKVDYNYEVLGVNALSYSFNRYCDFQYLPLVTNEKETKECKLKYIYEDLYPKEIPSEDWLTKDEVKDMPPFLPPGVFSRFDYQQHNSMFNKKPSNLFPLRQKGPRRNVIMSFENETIPEAPPEGVLEFIRMKPSMKSSFEEVKKLFDERPIWSRAALMYLSKMHAEHSKFVLPGIAYFNKNGPWRSMWVRYNYDPRKDPSAKIYQTFDFRIRATFGLKEIVKNKHKKASTDKKSLDEVVKHSDDSDTINENVYILSPGLLPAGRQIFYQLCDVKLPEIQTMLSRLPPILPGTKCDMKNGWLPDKFNDQCREIANKYIEEAVQKQLEETRRQNTIENQNQEKNNEEEKVVEMLEISDSDTELSDYDIIDNEFNSDDELKIIIKDNDEDSEEDFFDKEAADDVVRILGNTSKQ
ncbi:general transcription factor 3C polypeptide 5 [Onthophagus taurus]|uniref:general transcription factor 3C polypeptide 5 n=1 Tax=Onthophagus taurus TaxID=166361 RepID=UPI000C204FC0|nr:general transcription factor 3C polypeptide 5 [Onthophagus taurus]